MTIPDAAIDPSARPLQLVRGGTDIDLRAAERAVTDLLVALGRDP